MEILLFLVNEIVLCNVFIHICTYMHICKKKSFSSGNHQKHGNSKHQHLRSREGFRRCVIRFSYVIMFLHRSEFLRVMKTCVENYLKQPCCIFLLGPTQATLVSSPPENVKMSKYYMTENPGVVKMLTLKVA